MKKIVIARTAFILASLLILAGFLLKLQSQVRPPLTAAEQISRGMFFGQRIVPVGLQPTEEESQLLLIILNEAATSNYQTGLEDLEVFLNTYTNSPWSPSLDAALGQHYLRIGRITLALEHLELVWETTKSYPSGDGKRIADFALAHWTRLLASLGRYETLVTLVEENRGRVLDRGPLSQKWVRTREAVVVMQQYPGISYQCGTFALNSVASAIGITYDARSLLDIPSPATGFSMSSLAEYSVQFGLGLVPVARTEGDEIPVPAVVHWRQNHYGAIVSRAADLYKVVDPTFGYTRYMSAETINAEASGFFMIPVNRIGADHRVLASTETSLIYGRGNPNFIGDSDDQACETCECPIGPGGRDGRGSNHGGSGRGSGGCGGRCVGMPVWRVSEPYINLWLEDEPSGYQPAKGGRISFTLSFKQRDEYMGSSPQWFSSVGWSWNTPWLSSIDREYIYVHYGKGGYGYFDWYGSPNLTGGNYYNNLKLKALTNGLGLAISFELQHPNGAIDVYGFVPMNEYGFPVGRNFLSQKISPEGYVTSFYYEDYDPSAINIRLKHVVDPDGHTNTLYYATSGFSTNLITQVKDPFDRSTYLQYDEHGLLTNITDTASMSSSIAYNELGWPTNLTTPYGPTTFAHVDPRADLNWQRNITITEPNNSKQLYLFIQYPPYGDESYPSEMVPTNTPIGTLENGVGSRNSYHWSRLQYASLSTPDPDSLTETDYLKARMRHWLGATVHGEGKTMDTLSVQREASPDGINIGQLTWYDYPNKGTYGAGDKGDHILPGVTAGVLPDGSTWYEWTRRNFWGSPTNVVDTYTQPDGTIGLRTNHFVYAANGLDLVLHIGPQGEQVVSNYYGNAYHQVAASYDALNQETLYTYNGNRQLTSIRTPGGLTTTNIYFTSGDAEDRLEKTIDLEIARTNSYTYSGDLVHSHTDERGLTVTNHWDDLSRLTGRKYPDGTTTSNIYTALDITATKGRLGYWSYSAFNGIRQKVAETNANNVVTRYGLCDCGAVMSVTNAWSTPAEMVTSFGYDLQGNRTNIYYQDATVTNWYDSLQRVIVTGDAWGYRWFGYNNQGWLTSITNAFGAEQLTVFDIDDHPIYVTDANGVTITNTYDDLGRLSTRTYPDTGVEAFGYSARGLTAYTNQIGATNFYAYDEARRKMFETNSNWELIRYTNSPAGDLLALVDGKNQVTKWNYDEFGRVTNKLDQVGAEILRYTYDADGRLASRWSTAKGTTYYTNDPVGNLTKVNYPASTDVSLAYDALNRVTSMIDAAGTTTYGYTLGGFLWTEDGPWSSDTVTNIYNNRLRTGLSLAQPTGKWTNAFAYDAAKRLTNVTSPAGSFDYLLPDTRPSRLVSRIALPNTSYITNAYDNVARLLFTKLNKSDHTTLDSALYGYNAGNQRTTFTNAAGTYARFTYDNIGQLQIARVTNSSGVIVSGETKGYTYDAAWNLNYRTNNTTLQTFKVDTKNQLTNATPVSNQAYDGNGNVTSSESGSRIFSYDDENRLRTNELYATSRSVCTYDGLGRLRQREEYAFAGTPYFYWYLTATVRYVYDGMRVIQERNEINTPQVSYTRGSDLSGSLEGAGGIGGLLARSHGYSAGNWSVHYCYHADGNGNITYLVSPSQTIGASYRYDPYGNTISSSGGLASANTYRFSSKEFHVNSGLYYYGYRFYAPNLQRWLNRDPIGEDGGMNLHEFALNSPVMGHDPFGLASRYSDCMVGFLGKGDLTGECLKNSGCKSKADCEKCMDLADKACRLYADEKKYDSCAGKADCCKAEKQAVEKIKKEIQSGQASWPDLDSAYKALADCLTKNSGPDGKKPDIRKGDEQILPDAKKKCQ